MKCLISSQFLLKAHNHLTLLTIFHLSIIAATFVSFLLEVDSVYEVHDYIKSYLGETKDAHDFAKQFLDRRQKVRPMSQQQQQQQHPPTQVCVCVWVCGGCGCACVCVCVGAVEQL